MKVKKLISFLPALTVVCMFLVTGPAFAAQKSQPMPGESRLRFFNYQPNTVYEYTGFLRYAARIDLDPKEKIASITMGDPTGWQINPAGNRLFLKPTEVDAVTNMVVMTNKRIYYFELYSKEAASITDADLVWATKFNYTDSTSAGDSTGFIDMKPTMQKTSYVPDVTKDTSNLNMNYTVSGAKDISPIETFDDGEFTYFKFRNINAEYPAIFQVLPDGNEALINFRVSDNGYVVVEMVTSQFTLRFGNQLACIFNEKKPLERSKRKKGQTQSSYGVY